MGRLISGEVGDGRGDQLAMPLVGPVPGLIGHPGVQGGDGTAEPDPLVRSRAVTDLIHRQRWHYER